MANSQATLGEMTEWLARQPEDSWNKDIRSGYIHIASTFLIVAAFDILWAEGLYSWEECTRELCGIVFGDMAT